MWFWFSLIALICWSGSDLFSKIGCQDADDKYRHLKMVMAGEFEMEALAAGACRVLAGEEQPHHLSELL